MDKAIEVTPKTVMNLVRPGLMLKHLFGLFLLYQIITVDSLFYTYEMHASEYKKLASAKRVEAPLITVSLPSGATWRLYDPPIQQWVLAGKLPSSLVAKMATASKKANGDQNAFLQELSPEDLMQNLEFGRDLLLYCAAEPRISIDGSDPEAVTPEEIIPEDLAYLINWVMTGGKSGDNLSTFRSERPESAVDSADR